MWFKTRRRREREAAWARFSAIADRVGARDGQLIREDYEGGLMVSDGLGIITIRAGSPAEVGQAVLEAAVAMGYSRPAIPLRLPPGEDSGGDNVGMNSLLEPAELPMLTFQLFPVGSDFRGMGVGVPAGHTGLVITIG